MSRLVLYILRNPILIFEQLKMFILDCILIKFAHLFNEIQCSMGKLDLVPFLFLCIYSISSSSAQSDYFANIKNFASKYSKNTFKFDNCLSYSVKECCFYCLLQNVQIA